MRAYSRQRVAAREVTVPWGGPPAGVMGDAGEREAVPSCAWWHGRGDRPHVAPYSTVTDFARLRGRSMSRPRARAVW